MVEQKKSECFSNDAVSAAPGAPEGPPVIQNYEVLSFLGSGCFAQVFQARHIRTGVEVALKVTSKQDGDLDIVRNEIRALHRIGNDHPHIAQMYDFFEDDEYAYIVLEYCSGGSLHDFLLANGPVCERKAGKWFKQLIDAVAHCHARGVVSRDIKNANILLDSEGDLKLIDFGLAALVDDVAHDRLKEASGSAVFSAPEVYHAKSTPYLGPPAEVWSLGAVLHSMLARTLPFPVKGYRNAWHNYQPPVMVSPRARAMLLSIFQLDPAQRPTLQELQLSPWLARASGATVAKPSIANIAMATVALETQCQQQRAAAVAA